MKILIFSFLIIFLFSNFSVLENHSEEKKSRKEQRQIKKQETIKKFLKSKTGKFIIKQIKRKQEKRKISLENKLKKVQNEVKYKIKQRVKKGRKLKKIAIWIILSSLLFGLVFLYLVAFFGINLTMIEIVVILRIMAIIFWSGVLLWLISIFIKYS